MPASELDELAVNTIRGLCMDAIQKAESGHPGTPMGIAPGGLQLWQRVLRFDPSDPIWPNRDRFVLSEGHASALLWSLLHLSGVAGRRSRLRGPRPAGRLARRPQDVPPARLPLPGPPGVPVDERGRDDHRPARPGGRHVGRHGAGRPVAGLPLQPGRVHAVRLRRLRAGRRRLHDGGHLLGGGLLRGPPAAVQPVLDLRLQPGDDRGSHRHHVHGGRRRPVPGLRVERASRWPTPTTSTRSAAPSARPRPSTSARRSCWSTATSATAPRSRTRPRPTASRSGPRVCGRPSGSSACPRTSTSSSPKEVYGAFADGLAARREGRPRGLGGPGRGLPRRPSGPGRRARPDPAP